MILKRPSSAACRNCCCCLTIVAGPWRPRPPRSAAGSSLLGAGDPDVLLVLGPQLRADRLQRQPWVDRRRAVADQAGEVVDVPGVAALDHQVARASACRARSGGGGPPRPPSRTGSARGPRRPPGPRGSGWWRPAGPPRRQPCRARRRRAPGRPGPRRRRTCVSSVRATSESRVGGSSFASASGSRTGLSSSSRRACSGVSSSIERRGPISVRNDITSSSRSGSIGGLVTWANRCLK